jgi:hypothetical protein
LPIDTVLPLVLGGILSHYCRKLLLPSAKKRAKRSTINQITRKGLLIASGCIVGESLMGVFIASAIAYSGNSIPFALSGVHNGFGALLAGLVGFALLITWIYQQISHAKQTHL